MNHRDLILKHTGLVICILGATATPEMIDSVKADIFISANEHGAKLTEVDYVLAMDDVHTKDGTNMMARIRAVTDAPVIGPFRDQNDIHLASWPDAPRRYYTGAVSVWMAWAMGASEVVLVGMDCYLDEDGNYNESCFERYRQISEIVKCPVRIATDDFSNPLTELFPAYDPKEFTKKELKAFQPHPSIEAMLQTTGEIQVRVRKPTFLQGRPVHRNQILTGEKQEFARALKHRMVEEYFGEE